MGKLKKEFKRFKSGVCFYKELNCTYINMPKAACSSIRAGILEKCNHLFSLSPESYDRWTAIQEIDESFFSSFKFTIVRNPYTRIVSAYNNRLNKKTDTRKGFFKTHNIPMEKELSFLEFLQLIHKQCNKDIYSLDVHFAPQTHLMCPQFMAYDFIGHLENIKEDINFIADYVLLPNKKHNPSKGISIKDLSQKEIELILDIYKDDFALLGYDIDIGNLMPNKEKLSLSFFEKTDEKEKQLRKFVRHAKHPKFIRSCMHRIF